MLKKILFSITLLLVTLSLVTFTKAAITNSSRVIPYQGRLTDSSGNNVADSTYAMTFKIYTVSSGGSAAFTEAHSSVTVSSGLFSVLLGSLSANGVNLDFANPPYYLGITVGNNSEMSPRIQLGFAPLAHNSQYLDGTPLSSFQLNTGVLTGAAGTNTRLQATGTGTGSTGNGSIYFLNSSGTTTGRFDTVSLSATGGTITTSGGYTIHTFTSSGTFTPNGAGNVEILVVAGGGNGGSAGDRTGGGGGAGGLTYSASIAVTPQAYGITVGSSGTNSVALGITAIGGGAGSSGGGGGSGGSGGGCHHGTGGGNGTSGQGNNGGTTGYNSGNGSTGSFAACGGGGAGAAGSNASGTTAGSGGVGLAYSISGSSVYYAGGGGGGLQNLGQGGSAGSGGNGGGGSGGNNGSGSNGTANTGGGGGGGGNGSGGGAGGSGVVIIRYLTGSFLSYGTLYLSATNTSSADLAEYYVSGDKNMEPGDVVSIAPDNNSKGVLLKSNKSYDSKLVGVISTNPGVVLGSIDGDTGKSDKRQLALAGRVPVKIDPDSDPIEVGDFLTSSDKPGFAKKATESGYVIGKALENWTGQATIEVFINLIYKQEKSEIEIMKDDIRKLKQEVLQLKRL